MSEAILALVIVALLVERYFAQRAHASETQKLTNALIAKTPGELVALNHEPAPRRQPVPTLDGYEGQAGLS